MIRNFLFFFLLIGFLSNVTAQSKNVYRPDSPELLKSILEEINDAQLNRIHGSYASKIKKIYKDWDTKFLDAVHDSIYFFENSVRRNLDTILSNIYKANPEIDSEKFQFYIKNSLVPNAACHGNGVFEINLGLFDTCENDDELVFIICHEIAHQLLDHSLNRVSKRVSDLNSKETRKKITKIQNKRYGRTRAGLSLVDELNLDILDYSREKEAEADSLGYKLFMRTAYNEYAAITSLQKLEKEDDMIFDFEVKIDSIFDFEKYKFKTFWLEEEISLFDKSEKIDEFALVSDTVKTHPEIAFRIEKLTSENTISKSSSTQKYISNISAITLHQSIRYTIDLKLLDLAIYQLVNKFEKNLISSEYYYNTLAEVWKNVYVAKKNHDLGKYVPQKNSFSEEKNLNQIRLFLHNLELKEIKKIGIVLCESYLPKVENKKQLIEIQTFFNN